MTYSEPVVNNIASISYRPGEGDGLPAVTVEEKGWLDTVQEALGLNELRVVPIGGDEFEQEREQWDGGIKVDALRPGVVVACNRNE